MEKYQQYALVFSHFDEDGDGKVSASELRLCVESIGEDMSLEDSKAAVTLMDSDGDGLLCLEDFVRLVEGAGEEEKANDLKEAFRMYEMEAGCGYINPKSLKRMLSRLGQSKSIHECKKMIARFDLNDDGILSFHEFEIMMTC